MPGEKNRLLTLFQDIFPELATKVKGLKSDKKTYVQILLTDGREFRFTSFGNDYWTLEPINKWSKPLH